MNAQWKRAVAFAEYAEALGVNTREVMAVSGQGERAIVFYTPGTRDTLYSAVLARDADGVFYVARQPREEPELWAHLKDALRP